MKREFLGYKILHRTLVGHYSSHPIGGVEMAAFCIYVLTEELPTITRSAIVQLTPKECSEIVKNLCSKTQLREII